jgi:peptide/nickel transport system permease protein
VSYAETSLLQGESLLQEADAGGDEFRATLRRVTRNRMAVVCGCLIVTIVALFLAAPLFSRYVAHTSPNAEHLTSTIGSGSSQRYVVSFSGIPIGPTWRSRFFLGADPNGRDVLIRVLYGGRASLAVGFMAATITIVLATILGVAAGFFRGRADAVISRFLDIMWAYPAVLLGIAIGTVLAVGGISIGPVSIKGGSLFLPALIIGVVHIPYLARPIRGQVLAIREREYIDAARLLGTPSTRILVDEVLPNLMSTLVVFAPLILANSILLEAALSFLGVGVRAPNPSWGNMIGSGVALISRAPHQVIAPSVALVACVVGINGLAEGVREAIDPRGRQALRSR